MTTSRTPPSGDRVQPRMPSVPMMRPLGALAGALGICACAFVIPPLAAVASVSGTAKLLKADESADDMFVPTQAQADQKPHINIGKVILVEPASETPMPIQVGPLDAIPRNSFVRLRGLPGSAVLSEGHSIAPGAWAIPLAMLPSLRVSLPVGLAGKSDISIALVQIDGTVLAEARASLIIAAAAMIAPEPEPAPRERSSVASVGPTPSPLEASPPPAMKPPVPPASSQRRDPPTLTEEQKRATAFITRGRTLVEGGNISAARLFYRRAADAGLADGALALAGTYDPVELARLRVAGVQPDVTLAREWYEKARALGASEADERLRQLGASR